MLQNLLKYTAEADRKVIEIFHSHSVVSDRAILLFSHILNAQHIWISRIFAQTPVFERMQVHSPDLFLEISRENTTGLQLISDTLPPDQEIWYSISDGGRFVNTIEEILYHVVNHSTYHRGQLVSEFKQSGIAPPVTDFIIFTRNGEL